MIDADGILILISSTLILCYVSGLFYSKTKIPDIIWALGFGILLGPIFGIFDKDLFLTISPLMSTVALIIILFEAGINVDIAILMQTLVKSTILSITTIFTLLITIGTLLSLLMPQTFTLFQGMLLGTMIGSPCTIACFGILDGIEKRVSNCGNTRTLLLVESVIADPVSIIAAITLIKMIMKPNVSALEGLTSILPIFVYSIVFGFLIGILWAEMLHQLRKRQFTYDMTLAVLFPTYILTERLIGHGGGPIAVLIFSLVISNYNYLLKKLLVKRELEINKAILKEVHEEITFFIKSFFFVYIGLTATISGQYLLLGLGVFGIIQLLRYGIGTVLGRILKFAPQEQILSRLIFPLGLPAFVISQLPVIYDPDQQYFLHPELYPNLIVPIVLATVLFSALISPLIAKRQLANNQTRVLRQKRKL